MLFTNWLRNKKKSLERWLALSHERRQRLTTHPLARTLLCLEVLEDRVTPSSFETLYSFTGGNDGKFPKGAVLVDSNGNLDGTTTVAGAAQVGTPEGTVFRFNPSTQALTTLYSFSNSPTTNAFLTNVGVIQDSSGNFYGTTVDGGSSNDGTVFELSSDGTKFTILHSFTGGTGDGETPQAPLIMDLKGNLYGTTTLGGTSNNGTVFELSPNGSGGYNYTTLYSLNGSSDGSSPVQSLLIDSSGNLYGVAEQGGADSDGTVFELSPNGSGGYSFSLLHTFAGGTTDGGKPDTNLVMDSKGNLYGTTTVFGANSGGTAFKIIPSSDTYTTIYNFQRTGSGGNNPIGNILIDPSGNIYGVAEVGGNSRKGTVFELSPTGNLTTLHTFTGTGGDGSNPVGGLTEDSIGDFYGTTLQGGTNNDGTIFEIQGVITGLTTTKSSNVTATFSTNAQNVTLTANVSTGSGTVNAGTVTFTVEDGKGNTVGSSPPPSTVSNGLASVSYVLPANLALGTYKIDAVYTPGPGSGFLSSSDSTHTLTLEAANVTTTATASPASVPYSSTTSQKITLSASVTDASISTDTVNEGTVTFKVVNSSGITIASLPPSPVSQPSAQFTLPAGQAAGNYSIDAIYFDAAGNFIDDGKSDTPGTLQVTATPVTTTPSSPPPTAYSNNVQKIALSANLVEPSDPNVKISEGTVTFTVEDSNGTVGSPVTAPVIAGTTSGGTANANFNLPAGALPGTYTIDVHYDDSSGGLAQSGPDTTSTLTVNSATVTTTASPASTVYSTSAQRVKLTASIADTSIPSDTVHEGTVTFTVEDSNGNPVGSPVPPAPVSAGTTSGGTASAYFPTAGLAAGSYTIAVKYSDTNGNYTDSGDTNSTLTIAGIPVNTAASPEISAIYSPNNQQPVALSATVTDPAAPTNTINEGTVIFTVSSGGTTIGTAQGPPVKGGHANANFTTAGLAAGIYTIAVKYSDPNGNYSDNPNDDTSGTLNITPASVVTTAAHSDITFNTAAQPAVVLNATVADTSITTDTVDEGTVTFTIEDSKGNTVGSADGMVGGGRASAKFNWPAGRAAGTYTIAVSYLDSAGNFTEPVDSGVSNTLTVAPAVVTTTAISPPPAAYSPNAQNVTLSADVTNKDNDISSTSLNAGTVLFTVENGSTVIGSVQGAVSGGVANANFTLPAGLAVGSYNIDVSYSDSNGNFTEPTSGVGATLTVAPAIVATTAYNATAVLPSSTSVTLNAFVSDTSIPSDTVNEGSVTFAVEDSKGNAVGSSVQGTVSGGIASADFTLPSGLAAGNYTIGVSYTGSSNFSDNPSGDNGATLTVGLKPAVTASGNPINDTVSVGGTAVFTAAANGNPTPTVQWQVSTDGGSTFTNLSDGTNVSGSTSTTLTLSNVQASQSGYQYQAVFTNSYGTVTTSAATLTVPFPTTVTLNPINETVIAGKNVTFTAAASGGPTPTVQWQVSTDGGKTFTDLSDGTNVSGSTLPSLTLSNVQVSQNGYEYEAVFTNTNGSATTSAATLTVQYAPTVTLNPSSQKVTAGQTAAFTAAATSRPSATVQWQVSTDGGKTFSDISGAINPTYTLAGLTTAMSGYEYRAVFTNSVGSTATSAATLTVNPSVLPVITVNPVSQTVVQGATVSFTASANGNPAAAVQWQVSTDGGRTFSNIGGATSTTLTLSSVNPAMNGYEYQAVFSTGASSAVSIPASLTVNPGSGSSSNSLALNVPPLLALLGQLIRGIETINANDTETVVYSLFGFSLVTAHYDGSGNFIDATLFGFSIPNWIWNL